MQYTMDAYNGVPPCVFALLGHTKSIGSFPSGGQLWDRTHARKKENIRPEIKHLPNPCLDLNDFTLAHVVSAHRQT